MTQKIHYRAQKNWINDPNGFIWYKGQYHLFYQHFPYEPRWGTMHWGHAVSRDLVRWEEKEIALFPSKYDDQSGCYSGSAVEQDGKLYLYYTGVRYLVMDPQDTHRCVDDQFVAAQMLVTSEDGEHFDNIKNKVTVIPPLEERQIGDITHTRDPKVWRGKDAWYMILGSRTEQGKGKLLFYRSEDMYHWSFVNDAVNGDQWGWMCECPDYFEIGEDKVLLVSPMGILTDGKAEPSQTVCMKVEFDEESCTMQLPDTCQFMDYGMDVYAPQSTLDEEGRRVVTAWVRMPESPDGRWIGMHMAPRIVEIREGHICFPVHPNVRNAYTRRIEMPSQADEAGYRFEMELEDGEEINIGGYRIFRRGVHICTDRSRVFRNLSNHRMEFETPPLREGFRVEVYVDENLIEVYANNGEYVITNAVYDLGNDIYTEDMDKIRLFTLEA